MTTVNQDVETTDRIDILVTASSGTTVEPGAVTNCVINPQSRENSPFTYSISGFSGSSYTADFTDEVAGALQVTGSVAATGAWTSDKEQFTLRGNYGTKSLDLKYTAVKSKDGQIGGDGSDGLTGAGVNIVFTRSATDPGSPTPTPGVPTSQGWFDSPPDAIDNSKFLWASQGIIIPPSTDYTWGATYKVDGSVFAEVTVYRKNNNTPPSAALTWDFTTNTLSAGNWSTSLPTVDTANDIIYASVGLFSGHPTDTATALDGSWSAVVKYAERVDGEDGGSVNLVFYRGPSNPGAPISTTAIPDDTGLSPVGVLWADDPPATGGLLWVSRGNLTPPSADWTWGVPYQADGEVFAEVTIYRKGSNTLNVNDGTWDFTTNSLTLADWSTALPSVSGNGDIIYASVGLFAGRPTDTAVSPESPGWTIPVKYAERVDGEEGLKSLTGLVYLTTPSAVLPGTPTATNYVFSTVSFSTLTANWSLERPTITASNANNYWESTFNAKENTSASDVSSSSTSPPNLTFSIPVRVQDGFGDSVTQSVVDINSAATKWVGVDLITFSQDSTNAPHPRSSTEYKYTYNATTGNLEYAVGASNTDKGWTTTIHTLLAGSTEVARIKIRHIAEPFEFSGIQQTEKVKSVYYEFEVIGSPGATYSTESNYTIILAANSFTQSWVGGGSPVANGYDQIQSYDTVALAGYLVSITHTPSNALKTIFVSFSGIADSLIVVEGELGGK